MMIRRLRELWLDDSGVSAIEYALLAAGIALAIAATIGTLGDKINSKFSEISDKLDNNLNNP